MFKLIVTGVVAVVLQGVAKGPSPAEIKKHSKQTLKMSVVCPVAAHRYASGAQRRALNRAIRELAQERHCTWVYDSETFETLLGSRPKGRHTVEPRFDKDVSERIKRMRESRAESHNRN